MDLGLYAAVLCTPNPRHKDSTSYHSNPPWPHTRWFLNYYAAARRGEDDSDSDGDGGTEGDPNGAVGARGRLRSGAVARGHGQRRVKPLECTVRAGELLFVPRGW